MALTKICTKCGKELPADTEHFGVDKRKSSGLRYSCKGCTNEYFRLCRQDNPEKLRERARQYRQANLEKVRERERQYRQNNPEKVHKRNRLYQQNNPEKVREYERQYRQDNAGKIKERHRQYQQAHAEEIKGRRRQYYQANPEKMRIHRRNRRARLREVEGAHTAADILAQLKRQKNTCYYCHCKLTDGYHVDHVIPLSRGGSNGPENLVIACPTCNLSKHDKLPSEWEGSNGRLL